MTSIISHNNKIMQLEQEKQRLQEELRALYLGGEKLSNYVAELEQKIKNLSTRLHYAESECFRLQEKNVTYQKMFEPHMLKTVQEEVLKVVSKIDPDKFKKRVEDLTVTDDANHKTIDLTKLLQDLPKIFKKDSIKEDWALCDLDVEVSSDSFIVVPESRVITLDIEYYEGLDDECREGLKRIALILDDYKGNDSITKFPADLFYVCMNPDSASWKEIMKAVVSGSATTLRLVGTAGAKTYTISKEILFFASFILQVAALIISPFSSAFPRVLDILLRVLIK